MSASSITVSPLQRDDERHTGPAREPRRVGAVRAEALNVQDIGPEVERSGQQRPRGRSELERRTRHGAYARTGQR